MGSQRVRHNWETFTFTFFGHYITNRTCWNNWGWSVSNLFLFLGTVFLLSQPEGFTRPTTLWKNLKWTDCSKTCPFSLLLFNPQWSSPENYPNDPHEQWPKWTSWEVFFNTGGGGCPPWDPFFPTGETTGAGLSSWCQALCQPCGVIQSKSGISSYPLWVSVV